LFTGRHVHNREARRAPAIAPSPCVAGGTRNVEAGDARQDADAVNERAARGLLPARVPRAATPAATPARHASPLLLAVQAVHFAVAHSRHRSPLLIIPSEKGGAQRPHGVTGS